MLSDDEDDSLCDGGNDYYSKAHQSISGRSNGRSISNLFAKQRQSDEEASLHFALLAKIADRNGLTGLSMGMSGDFEKAIALGATHVRVGSAIFGARVPAQA